MLTYDLKQSNLPFYMQIYQCIKKDIVEGKLQPHEKLPSKRSFARQQGLSTITIQNAYDQLISEGFVYTQPKRGYFVAPIPNIPHASPVSLDYHLVDPSPVYDIDLSGNGTMHFPMSNWSKLSRRIFSEQSDSILKRSESAGTLTLRKAIALHLQSFRNMMVDPNQIIVGAGTEYLYGLLIQLLGRNQTVCLEDPAYPRLSQIYQKQDVSICYAGLDEQGISMEQLQKTKANIVHISPNHQFPTGIRMPTPRRYEILAWANQQSHRYIIEDDYDSEFRRHGKPLPTLFSMDESDRVIYMNTFSQSLSPTIRISYMVLPLSLAKRYYQELSFYACTVSNFEQYTLAAFLNEGYFEKHINRMRLYYGRLRKQIMATIKQSSLPVTIIENESGLHFLLQLKTHLSDAQIIKRMHAASIQIHALSSYYRHPQDRHTFLVNYSQLTPEKMQKVCDVFRYIISENNS